VLSVQGAKPHRESPTSAKSSTPGTSSFFMHSCMYMSSPQPCQLIPLQTPICCWYILIAGAEKTSRAPKILGPCSLQLRRNLGCPVSGVSLVRSLSGRKMASGSTFTTQSWAHKALLLINVSQAIMKVIAFSQEFVVMPFTPYLPSLTAGTWLTQVLTLPQPGFPKPRDSLWPLMTAKSLQPKMPVLLRS